MRNCAANDAVFTNNSSNKSPVPSLDTTQHHDHKNFILQQLQVYCDLDVISYVTSSSSLDAEFRARWPKEIHALIFKPIDAQAGVAVRQYEQQTVATSSATEVQYSLDAVSCDCGHIQAVVDALQVAELARIAELITAVRRRIRYRQCIPRGPIDNRLLPPVVIMPHAHSKDGTGDVNGRILPHLQWQKSRYEAAQNAYAVISTELSSDSTSSTRARNMWKYAITCVLQNVNRNKGDWVQRMHNGKNDSSHNLDTMIQYINLYGRTLVAKYARHSGPVNISKLHSSTPHLEKLSKSEQLWLADIELTLEQEQILFLRVCSQVAAHITVTSAQTASNNRAVLIPQWPPVRDNLVKLIRSMIVLRAGVINTKQRAKAALENSSNADDVSNTAISNDATVNNDMDAVVLEYFSRDGQRLDAIGSKHSKLKTFSDSDTDDSDDDDSNNSGSDSDNDGIGAAFNIVNSKQQVSVNSISTNNSNNNSTSSTNKNGTTDTASLGLTADISSMSSMQIACLHTQASSVSTNSTASTDSLPASTLLDTPGHSKFESMLNQDMSNGGGMPLRANTATTAHGSMFEKALLKQLLHLPQIRVKLISCGIELRAPISATSNTTQGVSKRRSLASATVTEISISCQSSKQQQLLWAQISAKDMTVKYWSPTSSSNNSSSSNDEPNTVISGSAVPIDSVNTSFMLMRLVCDPTRQLCPLFASGAQHNLASNKEYKVLSSSGHGCKGVLSQLRAHIVIGAVATNMNMKLVQILQRVATATVDNKTSAKLSPLQQHSTSAATANNSSSSTLLDVNLEPLCKALQAVVTAAQQFDTAVSLPLVKVNTASTTTAGGKVKTSTIDALPVAAVKILLKHIALGARKSAIQVADTSSSSNDYVTMSPESVIHHVLASMLPYDFELKVRIAPMTAHVIARADDLVKTIDCVLADTTTSHTSHTSGTGVDNLSYQADALGFEAITEPTVFDVCSR
jgi:Vacuolar sorting-associated protein 13, N-terminal